MVVQYVLQTITLHIVYEEKKYSVIVKLEIETLVLAFHAAS